MISLTGLFKSRRKEEHVDVDVDVDKRTAVASFQSARGEDQAGRSSAQDQHLPHLPELEASTPEQYPSASTELEMGALQRQPRSTNSAPIVDFRPGLNGLPPNNLTLNQQFLARSDRAEVAPRRYVSPNIPSLGSSLRRTRSVGGAPITPFQPAQDGLAPVFQVDPDQDAPFFQPGQGGFIPHVQPEQKGPVPHVQPGQEGLAPHFTVEDLTGKGVSNEEHRARLVKVKSMPELQYHINGLMQRQHMWYEAMKDLARVHT